MYLEQDVYKIGCHKHQELFYIEYISIIERIRTQGVSHQLYTQYRHKFVCFRQSEIEKFLSEFNEQYKVMTDTVFEVLIYQCKRFLTLDTLICIYGTKIKYQLRSVCFSRICLKYYDNKNFLF